MTITGDDRRSTCAAMESRVRLDKWLWAARFFKTRALAAEAVTGGKVHAGGQRVKPSHAVRLGERLRVQRGAEEYCIEIKALSIQRRPAKEAVLLYEETAESRQRREELREQRHLQSAGISQSTSRPTKRDRRRIIRLIRGDE